MEYAHGGDLYTMLESSPNGLEERLVKAWIAEAADAIEWLHSRGWCHRFVLIHHALLPIIERLAQGTSNLTICCSIRSGGSC